VLVDNKAGRRVEVDQRRIQWGLGLGVAHGRSILFPPFFACWLLVWSKMRGVGCGEQGRGEGTAKKLILEL
jgi:hypothetical protein